MSRASQRIEEKCEKMRKLLTFLDFKILALHGKLTDDPVILYGGLCNCVTASLCLLCMFCSWRRRSICFPVGGLGALSLWSFHGTNVLKKVPSTARMIKMFRVVFCGP